MPELLSVPQTEPRQLGALRKAADRACRLYAQVLRQHPDIVWEKAMKSQLDDMGRHEEGREFDQAFFRLRAAERMTILHYSLLQ